MTKHIYKLSTGCLKDIIITGITVPDLNSTTPEATNIVSIPSVWMNDYGTTSGTSSKITYNPITITYPSTWFPTTPVTTSEIYWPGRTTNTDGDSYIFSNHPACMYDDVNYDDIVEIKDPDKEGIFIVGALYKAYKDIPYIYFDVECEELFTSKASVMCLGSELLPSYAMPIIKEKIINGIKHTRDLNRVYVTKFLLKEKIISYSWYENAEILSRQQNIIPFGSHDWLKLVQDASTTYNKNEKRKVSLDTPPSNLKVL